MTARAAPIPQRLAAMNESEKLRKGIARLTEPVETTESGQRRLAAETPEALMPLLVTEIAETILPRTLILETADGPGGGLFVSGGRVHALLPASGGTVAGSDFADPEAFAAAVAAWIGSVLGHSTEAFLRTEAAPADGEPEGLSCPAGLIASALRHRQTGAAGLCAFAATLSGSAPAWCVVDATGRIVDAAGPEGAVQDLLATLSDRGQALDAILDAAAGGGGRPGMAVSGPVGASETGLLVARSDGAHLAAQLAGASDGATENAVLRLWRDTFGN